MIVDIELRIAYLLHAFATDDMKFSYVSQFFSAILVTFHFIYYFFFLLRSMSNYIVRVERKRYHPMDVDKVLVLISFDPCNDLKQTKIIINKIVIK